MLFAVALPPAAEDVVEGLEAVVLATRAAAEVAAADVVAALPASETRSWMLPKPRAKLAAEELALLQ